MLYLILFLAFVSIILLINGAFRVVFQSDRLIQSRLNKISILNNKNAENELNLPIYQRLLKPMLENTSRVVLKVTPKGIIDSLEKKVIMAGNPQKLSTKNWINIQVSLIVCLPVLTLIFAGFSGTQFNSIVFYIILEIAIGLVIPNFILGSIITKRQKMIQNTLPDVIDLLTVSVEAGLGFDGALARVIEKMPGPLSEEFGKVLQEIKVGKQKREALKDMADRAAVRDLSTFIGAIIQADQFGVGMGNVLRIQSDQMRQKRRQRAQEKAMKAPIKMLIPMILFIFPSLFAVLLGPVVIKVIDVFIK